MRDDLCYMCKKTATSREHVPPKCLFPEQKDLPTGIDLRKNLITVPSCDEHNTEKSKDDEYLLYAIVMNIANNGTAFRQFSTKILRAIEKKPGFFNNFSKDNKPVVAVDENGVAFNTLIVKIDNRKIMKVLDHISRALYFYHNKHKFTGKCSVLYDFAIYSGSPNEVVRNERNSTVCKFAKDYFNSLNHHGENPDVFRYSFDSPDSEGRIALKMQFYGGSHAYVAFVPENNN